MGIEEDIRQFLTDQGVTDPITIGSLSVSPDTTITILDSGGNTPDRAMGPVIVNRRHTFQVISRDVKDGYAVGKVMARQVHGILESVGEVTILLTTYNQIMAVGEPAFAGVDRNERVLFTANYEAWERV